MVKPPFSVESRIWKKTPIYLVSGTTTQHYIVPSVKEQLFFYKNPVLDNIFPVLAPSLKGKSLKS